MTKIFEKKGLYPRSVGLYLRELFIRDPFLSIHSKMIVVKNDKNLWEKRGCILEAWACTWGSRSLEIPGASSSSLLPPTIHYSGLPTSNIIILIIIIIITIIIVGTPSSLSSSPSSSSSSSSSSYHHHHCHIALVFIAITILVVGLLWMVGIGHWLVVGTFYLVVDGWLLVGGVFC